MEYNQMSKEQKMKYVDEFVSVCESLTETEIRILYLKSSRFRLIHGITQKFFVEYFVEPVIEKLRPFLEVVENIKKELQANYVQAIQSNQCSLNDVSISRTMSLGV